MKTLSYIFLVLFAALIAATWYAAEMRLIDWLKVEDLGPLFAGLGCVVIAAAILHVRGAAAGAAAAQRELLEAMLVQASKTASLINATARNSRILGLAAELGVREWQIVTKDPHEGAVDIAARRTALLEELTRLL